MRLINYSARDPFGGLARLQDALDRAFERPFGLDLGPSGRGVFPPINVFRDEQGYVVKAEVPGFASEDLSVEGREQTLTVSGKPAPEESKGSYHRRERRHAEFSRSIQLPADADPSAAQASYRHGVLSVRVPKHERAQPRRIQVKAG
jgi:HSP20 family protein